MDINKFNNQIVFFGFCPGADFSRRLDTRWKELGICEFQYFESKVQVERFASIEVGDLIVLKKRQIIGKTMRVYGYGLVTGITKDDKGNRVLKVDWSSQEQVIEVPLLGCNATIDIRDIDKVRAEMPDAFFEWLNQGAGISNLPKPASKTEAAVLEDSEIDEDSSEQELIDAAYWDDVEAMEYLGSGYANGKWGEEDSANSFKWYMKAAEHGSEMGMFNAASYLVQGDVVEQNMELALLFLNKLAVGSDYSADANHNLGVIYENGIGNIPKDVTKAKEYYLKAKDLGSNEAAEALQSLTEDNVSVQETDQEYNDLLKAAEAGDAESQFQMSMYCSKRAESNDESEAEKQIWANRMFDWGMKAAVQKHELALRGVADIYLLKENYESFKDVLEFASQQNYGWATYNLSVFYEKGVGCPQDLEKAFELTKKAADQGWPQAMRIMGYCYDVGEGVEKNEIKAFTWTLKAAEAGDAKAQLNLADMYATAAGTERNIEQAQYWALKAFEAIKPAAEQGDVGAQFDLGVMYDQGRGVAQDDQQAFTWYRKAAEQGDAGAQYTLGVMYNQGQGVPQDDQQAVTWFRKAAEQGYAMAQCNLGVMYATGQGVAQDDQQAVTWYRKAAEQGHAMAQCKLGKMYTKGQGVTQDHQQAFTWYRKAAEQGDASAQLFLGVMYATGEGVAQDDQQAVTWYRKAAEQGKARAQCNLGVMYNQGQGVAQDDQQAVTWFRKAAEQGDAEAQFNLGVMYATGQGVAQDGHQVVTWFRKAAEHGFAMAQYNLGVMYEQGQGVAQDDQQAATWYCKAAEQGYAAAQYNLGLLYKQGLGVAQDDQQAVTLFRKAAEQGIKEASDQLNME